MNNIVSNLEWCTQRENIEWKNKQHRGSYKLTKEQEQELEKDIINNKTTILIFNKYNITSSFLYEFKKRKSITKISPRKYNINLNDMIQMINKGMTNYEIAQKLNCSTNLVARRKYQISKGEI